MSTKPTYEELAKAIAFCVHARMYGPETTGDMMVMQVYDMASSGYQVPAFVLHRFDILESRGGSEQRHDFTCLPKEFCDRIARNKTRGCSYDTLVLAAICLLEIYPNQPDIRKLLVRLGVCEPFDDDEDRSAKWREDVDVKWTDRYRDYNALMDDWPELVDHSKYDDPCI
jgi:hypothetical protein